jgi:hypothetical protein
MATIISAAQWSSLLRRERALKWTLDWNNEAGPAALDGTRQYGNSTGGPLWRAAYLGEQLRTREQVLAWMAQEAVLRGGATPVDVPSLLCGYKPTPDDGAPIVIAAVDGWAARAVQGRITLTHAGELIAGMHFADYDATTYGWRMHRIATVAAVMGHGLQRDITFVPPARFAVADGHALEFDEPRCVMRLAASDSMDVELELRKRGNPNAQFVEAF